MGTVNLDIYDFEIEENAIVHEHGVLSRIIVHFPVVSDPDVADLMFALTTRDRVSADGRLFTILEMSMMDSFIDHSVRLEILANEINGGTSNDKVS